MRGWQAVPGRAPSRACATKLRFALGGDQPRHREAQGKVFQEAGALGHFTGTMPPFAQTGAGRLFGVSRTSWDV